MAELSYDAAALLEAVVDPRIGSQPGTSGAALAALEAAGWLDPAKRRETLRELRSRAIGRPIEWATQTVTQGEVLAAFSVHCRDELGDVEVVFAEAERLEVRWRDEESRFELRNGFVGIERLVSGTPTMLLGDIDPVLDDLVAAFLDDAELRSRLAVCDLGRLERLGTVRSSAFVYFEWFLRDAYGVKLLPNGDFTRGLIDRGIISLGMG